MAGRLNPSQRAPHAAPKPFRLRPSTPLESEIHQQLVGVLNRHLLPPAEWACYPAGAAQLSPQQRAKYSRMGLKRGWPDILIVYDSRIYGLELKRKGGRLSKSHVGRTKRGAARYYIGQAEMFPRLQAAGMTLAVVYSLDEALVQITRWGIPFCLSPKLHDTDDVY